MTHAGRAVYAEAVERATRVNKTLLSGFGDAQRTTLISLLNALLDHHSGLLDYREE